VHAAFFIPEYRANPRKLCPVLGLSPVQLKRVMTKLRHLGSIELESDGNSVVRVSQTQIHYGTDHPLMRTYQSLLREKCSAQLTQTAEEDKHSFMATFSADEDTHQEIRKRFQGFLKELEQLVAKSPSEKLFQLNFDLFRWF
jgi:hypothetical protein